MQSIFENKGQQPERSEILEIDIQLPELNVVRVDWPVAEREEFEPLADLISISSFFAAPH